MYCLPSQVFKVIDQVPCNFILSDLTTRPSDNLHLKIVIIYEIKVFAKAKTCIKLIDITKILAKILRIYNECQDGIKNCHEDRRVAS